jgi:hypothetical protein
VRSGPRHRARDIIAALRDDARFARCSTREKLAEDARER